MANLIESPVYVAGIFQLEKTTPALGGAPVIDAGIPSAGHANAQAQQLANRTAWLKEQVDSGGSASSLAANLANTSDNTKGAELIGWDGDTVGAQMNLSKKLASYAAMRAYTGPATRIEVTKYGLAGFFTRRAFAAGDVDNGGTILVSTNGLWTMVRDFIGHISLWWFECPLDGVTNADAAFAKFTAAVKNGKSLIPPIKYVATEINFNLVGQGPTIGGLQVEATGASIIGECVIKVDSCKRLKINGLEGFSTDLHLNGSWFLEARDLKMRHIILGSSAGTQFSDSYWNNFFGGQYQSIETHVNSVGPSNKFSFYGTVWRGNAQQGFTQSQDYFMRFNAKQNVQGWSFFGGDASYYALDMLYVNPAVTDDIELCFDGMYFDSKYPRLPSRAKTKIEVRSAHAANDMPNTAAISEVSRGSSEAWRGDRSAGWKSFTAHNLIPNGDFYDILPAYVGANLPIGGAVGSTITAKTGAGINGNYLNILQPLTTANAVRFRSKVLPITSRYTGLLVLRNADVGNKTVRISVGGLFFNAALTDADWSVVTLTTGLDLAAGAATDILLFTDDGTQFNVDVCYAGVFVGESPPLFLPSSRRQTIDGSMSWNPASVAAGAQVTQDVALAGAALGDFARASFGISLQGMTLSASVVSAGTVQVTMRNGTATAIDLGVSTLRVRVDKSGY